MSFHLEGLFKVKLSRVCLTRVSSPSPIKTMCACAMRLWYYNHHHQEWPTEFGLHSHCDWSQCFMQKMTKFGGLTIVCCRLATVCTTASNSPMLLQTLFFLSMEADVMLILPTKPWLLDCFSNLQSTSFKCAANVLFFNISPNWASCWFYAQLRTLWLQSILPIHSFVSSWRPYCCTVH